MPTAAWIVLAVLWLPFLFATVTRLPPLRRTLAVPDADRYQRPRRSERTANAHAAFAVLVWLVPVVLVVLGEPLIVGIYWLLALFALGYLVTMMSALVGVRQRRRQAERV